MLVVRFELTSFLSSDNWKILTIELLKHEPTALTIELMARIKWSLESDLNRQPADYWTRKEVLNSHLTTVTLMVYFHQLNYFTKSAALPIEPSRHINGLTILLCIPNALKK